MGIASGNVVTHQSSTHRDRHVWAIRVLYKEKIKNNMGSIRQAMHMQRGHGGRGITQGVCKVVRESSTKKAASIL